MDPRIHRGIVGKPRRGHVITSHFGSPIPMCWYCGSCTWVGELVICLDGTLLHKDCQQPAARDYPDRVAWDAEQADAKVRWQDVRGAEGDARAFWA